MINYWLNNIPSVSSYSSLTKPHLLTGVVFLLIILAPCHGQAEADDSVLPIKWNIERWYIYTSVYTQHVSPKPDHVNDQNMFGIEAQNSNSWVLGATRLDNSFGQKSEYLYTGYKWNLLQTEKLCFKLTGGLLHGYKGKYKDKIPFNSHGTAPVIVPTLSYRYKSFVTDIILGGVSTVTVAVGITF